MSESIYGDRDLDRQVAEALGWRWVTDTSRAASERKRFLARDPSSWRYFEEASADIPLYADWYSDTPRYSTDPAAYMGLLEEMERRGCNFVIGGGSPYTCSLWWKGHPRPVHEGCSRTLGEAMSLAVLVALKAEDK
jgi:hypothetical protein